MKKITRTEDVPICLTKAEVYEHIKFQLLEMKEKENIILDPDQGKRSEKIAGLINNLEELDKTYNGEKLQYIEMEITLKNEIKKLNAKLELKEIEQQQLNDSIKDIKQKAEDNKRIMKERLFELKERVLECIKMKNSEDMSVIRSKLEMMFYRLNYFIQNDTNTLIPTPERTVVAKEIVDKYQSELCNLSLSQRENAVYDKLHQSGGRETLKDICLDDLLKIPSKAELKVNCCMPKRKECIHKEEYAKFMRLFNCRSAIISLTNEFDSSEDSMDDSVDDEEDLLSITQEMENYEDNKEIEPNPDLADNNTIVEVTETKTTPKCESSLEDKK